MGFQEIKHRDQLIPDSKHGEETFESMQLLGESYEQHGIARIKADTCGRFVYCLFGILLVSLSLNAFLVREVFDKNSQIYGCLSRYTGLAEDTHMTYSSLEGGNETSVDEYWESLDTGAIVVALDHEYTDNHGLARSVPFPWDDEKGLYHIKAFHQLHCLKVIRKSFLEPEKYSTPEEVQEHVLHCLHTLRQDIMCRADDTLMPSEDRPHAIGDKQVLQCRSWEALVAWARAPERNSCYEMISEYVPVSHRLEQYGFCPESSPHYAAMKRYFERWGHKPMFDDGVTVDY